MISDGIVKGNDDPRDHFYIARCNCGKYKCCPRAPIMAERWAHRHARRLPGHEAYVVDVTALEVKHRYRFDAIEGTLDPNSDQPPF